MFYLSHLRQYPFDLSLLEERAEIVRRIEAAFAWPADEPTNILLERLHAGRATWLRFKNDRKKAV